MSNAPKWIHLNNEMMIQKDGKYQFNKDKEAVKSYFVNHINQNTVFFHNLREKIDYLIENDYYEQGIIEQYDFKEIKTLFKHVYSVKFRFPSFMSAFKFYNNYALRTEDNKKYLERYEDRICIVALTLAEGNINKAFWFADKMIKREYQPATPTFLSAGKKDGANLLAAFF